MLIKANGAVSGVGGLSLTAPQSYWLHHSCFLTDQKWSSLSLFRPLRATLAFQARACQGIRGVRFCDGTVNSNYCEASAPVKIPWCQEEIAALAGGAPALESPEDPLGRRPIVLIRPTPVLFHCTITATPAHLWSSLLLLASPQSTASLITHSVVRACRPAVSRVRRAGWVNDEVYSFCVMLHEIWLVERDWPCGALDWLLKKKNKSAGFVIAQRLYG